MMNKPEFYTEQAGKFRDYAKRMPNRDLSSLFEQWAGSKDLSDEDKKEIWNMLRKIKP